MLDLKKIEAAINHIAAERGLHREDLIEIIESAIRTAYKKDYGNKDDIVNVKLDFESGDIIVTLEKTVVDEVVDPNTEISKADLGEDADAFDLGDIIEIDVSDVLRDNEQVFGRIASQAARQVIIQKIGETEKAKVYEIFKDKEGEIVNVRVDMVENDRVFLEFNGSQILLPRSEQVSRDKYTAGMRLHVFVKKVQDEEHGEAKIILSRKDAGLVAKLFELSTPELEDGTIEIVKIVREPGFKTKIIVASEFEEVDPAGALIGPKGIRVKAVVEELSGEKVDVINYTDNARELVAQALNPARILDVQFDEEGVAQVTVPKSDEVRAIGRSGGNVRLAEQLTGYRIRLIGVEEEGGAAVE
jgi:transcription termination/antitermination protein NusA